MLARPMDDNKIDIIHIIIIGFAAIVRLPCWQLAVDVGLDRSTVSLSRKFLCRPRMQQVDGRRRQQDTAERVEGHVPLTTDIAKFS